MRAALVLSAVAILSTGALSAGSAQARTMTACDRVADAIKHHGRWNSPEIERQQRRACDEEHCQLVATRPFVAAGLRNWAATHCVGGHVR